MNLIIDIGNTRAKIAVFNKDNMLVSLISEHNNTNKNIEKLKKTYNIENCILSSVANVEADLEVDRFNTFVKLNHKTKVPFQNKYKTPTTLGVDRIALASGAANKYPNKNVLIIDSGTCITYDFINTKNEYLGGAISPGIDIRYKSLNQFTANLPLLEQADYKLIGTDTKSSIHSGVLNGFIQEIDGVIGQYQRKYSNLTVVLTGGDTKFLAKKLKSSIFATPNFLLEGLNSILIYNLNE
ncbi:type III pantothenate kinase [Aureibaculum sp. 2210JD6-5]|uniref:type III pantothenate kinase n=1 Tax=Aureibaculum sp. 2210JD6-5 TaxID=3103957 RepID=UPI002AAEC578|nr:type III pantothenate kinase [Aureibaculum sp. 2210JD6-5]MDY7394772.1 type III pantothenate kinase [Aureibaculum sp. 2210JD6-5]